MKNAIIVAVFCAGMLSIPAFVIEPARAQTEIAKKAIAKAEVAIEKTLDACEAEIQNYCSKVTPGEGRLALCMMAHEDKVSDKCYGAVFDIADSIELAISNVWRAAEVCEADADKVCPDVKPGEGRIAQCLIDNKAKLSSSCQAEVTAVETHLKH